MNRRDLFVLLSLAAFLLAAALRFLPPASPPAESTTLLVAAAASLQDALEELDSEFESTMGITVSYNLAASSPLQQIEQGAAVDRFISAATQTDALRTGDLILSKTRRNLLTNELVLIVPSRSTLSLTTFEQMTEASVNQGQRQKNCDRGAVQRSGRPLCPRTAGESGHSRTAAIEIRLRQLGSQHLGTVESGNADVGIVSATAARIFDRVHPVATDAAFAASSGNAQRFDRIANRLPSGQAAPQF